MASSSDVRERQRGKTRAGGQWVGPLARLLHWGPWLIPAVAGLALGIYGLEFVTYNVDFTGPHTPSLLTSVLVMAVGLAVVPLVWLGYSWVLSRLIDARAKEISKRDALAYLPIWLFLLSPLFYLVTGRHTTEYQALVVVLVTIAVSGVAGLKVFLLPPASLNTTIRNRLKSGSRVVWAASLLYILIIGTLVLLRYNAYNVWGVDIGLRDQALWNTLHGRFMEITYYGGVQTTLFAFHFEPIYLLLLPLYTIWADPRLLFLVQATAVGLGAIPLYGLARQRLGSEFAATCFALGYLVFPAIAIAGLDSSGSLRSDTLAIPVLLWALYFLERGQRRRFLVTVLLALACKEYVALVVGFLGLYILWRKRDIRLGLATIGMAIVWFVVVMWGIIPYFRGGGESYYYGLRFSHLGGETGLAGVVRYVISNPAEVLSLMFMRSKLIFLFFLLFSMGLLPLLDLPALLVSTPIFAIFFLLPGDWPISLGDFHFFAALPFVFLAAIGGVDFLHRQGTRLLTDAGHLGSFSPARQLPSISVFFLLSCILAGFFWGPSPLSWTFWSPGRPYEYGRNLYVASEHEREADRLVCLIPDGAPVVASDYLLSRLTQREAVYHFFQPPDDVLERVDYAVVDLLPQLRVRTRETADREVELLKALLDGPDFALTTYENGLLLFQRDGTSAYTSSVEVLAEDPLPHVRLERDLGRRLRLLGYDPPVGPLQAGARCRASYYWQVLEGFATPFDVRMGINPESVETHQTDYVLADQFVGAAGEFSVLHLPTYIQLPPGEWQPGQVIRETYDFRLPADPQGVYDWSVGLYVVPEFLGIRANAERQVPGSEPVAIGALRVSPGAQQ